MNCSEISFLIILHPKLSKNGAHPHNKRKFFTSLVANQNFQPSLFFNDLQVNFCNQLASSIFNRLVKTIFENLEMNHHLF